MLKYSAASDENIFIYFRDKCREIRKAICDITEYGIGIPKENH